MISLYPHHVELALKTIMLRIPYLLDRPLTEGEKKHLGKHRLDLLWRDLKPTPAATSECTLSRRQRRRTPRPSCTRSPRPQRFLANQHDASSQRTTPTPEPRFPGADLARPPRRNRYRLPAPAGSSGSELFVFPALHSHADALIVFRKV